MTDKILLVYCICKFEVPNSVKTGQNLLGQRKELFDIHRKTQRVQRIRFFAFR
jgi:hypothetical protein